jgi:hypothetical protein
MEMWSCARYDLHLSDEQFFILTPRKLDSLLKRHKRKAQSNELLFAQLTSWVANTGFRSTAEPTKTEDFMPSRWKQDTAKPAPKRRKRDTIAMEARRVMSHFMCVPNG